MAENGLAKALADFQGSGFAIPRLRTVTVETKKGGQYTFDYAPHELIVAAVRKPLADLGLAVSQPLATTGDGRPGLRTILMHTSGESIDSVFPLPTTDGMTAQELGSAITYIRRYALSAILGLATEDDDDGNRASGNDVSARRDRAPKSDQPDAAVDESGEQELLTGRVTRRGTIRKGGPDAYKLVPRQTPEGYAIGFRLDIDKEKAIPQVLIEGEIGAALLLRYPDPLELLGTAATVSGILYNVRGRQGSWYRLHVDRFENADIILPAATGGTAGPSTTEAAGPADEPPVPAAIDEIDALPMFREGVA